MKILLKTLHLTFNKSRESLPLGHVMFFWGKIGAGKSSIARLIDYCLGADIHLTPALQQEFVGAELEIVVGDKLLTIYRQREASKVVAVWQDGDQTCEILLPARKAEGIVLPGTKVEVLSDLLFHLAGLETPLVRKGKRTNESRLERLSFRDLFRFCYLDQDGMDSDFFRLDLEGDWARRQKSIDAMRFILGYHQDRVAALEAQVQDVHEQKLAAKTAAEALKKVLEEAGFSNPAEIDANIEVLRAQHVRTTVQSEIARQEHNPKDHAVDRLRETARNFANELQSLEDASQAINRRAEDIERHLNELKMLSVRFHRTSSARAALAGVEFQDCPRCSQHLPARPTNHCSVCGQLETEHPEEHVSDKVIDADLKSRLEELHETSSRLKLQKIQLGRSLETIRAEKEIIDNQLSEKLRQYDSKYMSQALEFERQVTYLEQRIDSLLRYRQLPDKLAEQFASADELQGQESELKAKLAREREAAFRDRDNLDKLQEFFLDCLVRASFPGVNQTFNVSINAKDFIPELSPSAEGNFAVTSFANMGSGGMKSIFKSCYALALHRLASYAGANLPNILILDSPMKSISTRENRELFESFFRLVYELAATELQDTQFILVDSDFCDVPEDINLKVSSRHMAPGSAQDLPLIPYLGVL